MQLLQVKILQKGVPVDTYPSLQMKYVSEFTVWAGDGVAAFMIDGGAGVVEQ